jgi:cytochrome P450
MDEMLVETRRSIQDGEAAPSKPNLMSALIRSSDKVNLKDRLSDDEIKGNLFLFNMGGHDTTANTFVYAFALLALDRDCRNWLREELDQCIHDGELPSYEDIFPRLTRCQAVMVCHTKVASMHQQQALT